MKDLLCLSGGERLYHGSIISSSNGIQEAALVCQCQLEVLITKYQDETFAKKLIIFPSGSRNQTERLPHVWEVGGLTKVMSICCRRSYSLSTSSTSNSSVYLPHPEPCSEPGAIPSIPSSVKSDKMAPS